LTIGEAVLGSSFLLIAFASIYLLMRALLPLSQGYHIPQQIAVAAGLAVVSLGFIAMALSYTRWKITLWSLIGALVLLSIASLAMAMYLHRLMPEQALHRETAMTWWESIACSWRNKPLVDRLSWLFLGFAVALSFGLLPILASNQRETFSEFYVDLSKFPDGPPWREALAPGDTISLPVTVVSHEADKMRFRINVLIDEQQHLLVDLGFMEPEQESTKVIPLSIDQVGLHGIKLDLYKGELPSPYRSLQIWLDVHSE
jgi:uncharacterized membrane protein